MKVYRAHESKVNVWMSLPVFGSGQQLASGTYESVQNYYGKVLGSSKDLKTSACTSSSKPSPSVLKALRSVPGPVVEKFYGCGTPVCETAQRARTRTHTPVPSYLQQGNVCALDLHLPCSLPGPRPPLPAAADVNRGPGRARPGLRQRARLLPGVGAGGR